MIVRLGDGNGTQRGVFYGSSASAGAHLVVNERIADAIRDCSSGSKDGCLAKAVDDSIRSFFSSDD